LGHTSHDVIRSTKGDYFAGGEKKEKRDEKTVSVRVAKSKKIKGKNYNGIGCRKSGRLTQSPTKVCRTVTTEKTSSD